MPSTKAKYTPMMTQSISLGCTSPPFLFVDGSARVRRGPRAATLIDAAIVGVRRIQRQELARHAVGPAEAVLQRVLAAAARTVGVHHVVLLEQFAALAVGARHIHRPAARNLLGERRLSVGVESGHRDPLQRRPAVRRIPLLAGIAGGRDHAAPLEEAPSRGAGDRGGLGRGGGMHEQRVERGRRYVRDALAPCPLIIEIGAAHRVPEISVQDRKSTRLNSSHLVISYAVFCLKKKTVTTNFINVIL